MSDIAIKSAAFTDAYKALNPEQRQAVDTIDGPVMVIAGPGTGKTQILTLRIANILLQTDTAPESILALTFTDAGAKNMRERLERYVGRTAYRVPIYTFHGFAQHIIREYPDAFTRVVGGRPASDLERIRMIENILEAPEVATLRPLSHPTYYVRPVLQQISELKKENVSPSDLAKIVSTQAAALTDMPQYHEKGAHKGKQRGDYSKAETALVKSQALQYVYTRYEALLAEERLFDFEDMIMETVAVLANNETLLLTLQEQYQYVLADEHQDVNGAQNRIIELLTSYHDHPNIFVVGDEKQAIYRFQGASLENFLHFTDLYPDTVIIKLTDNYRSGPAVLDAAHSLIAVEADNPLADLRVPLTAAAVPKATINKRIFPHEVLEEAWLTKAVADALARGVPAEEIAVIVRSNKEVEQFAHALRQAGIAVYASADGDILDHPLTHTIQALLRAVIEPETDEALFRVFHGAYWGLPLSDTMRVLQARHGRASLYEVLQEAADGTLDTITHTKTCAQILSVLESARALAAVQSPSLVVAHLLHESRLLAHTAKHNPVDGLRVIRRLYDELDVLVTSSPEVTLADVLRYFKTTIDYRLPITAPFIKLQAASVQVLTAHKAKGLEYDVVFIPHLTDNRWNGKARRNLFTIPLTTSRVAEAFDALDDERRLLYVALTRARTEAHVSYAEQNQDGKDLLPAELLVAIDETYITDDTKSVTTDTLDLTSSMTPVIEDISDPVAFVSETLRTRGFSATSFNNYMQNPWDYFYRNVLRIPEVKPLHMHFGTVMHAVLEALVKQGIEPGTEPPFTDVTTALKQALTQTPISSHAYQQLYEQGVEALGAYLPTLVSGVATQMKTEYSVRVTLKTGLKEFPELPLSGTFDRIDYHQDGTIARIIDYKTGQPKSRNEIEGNTKNSDGRYKRQLVFYALLLSLYDEDLYTSDITYTLSFVQPAKNGSIKEESFMITAAEVEALQAEIITGVSTLLSGTWIYDQAVHEDSEYTHFVTEFIDRLKADN